MPIQRSPVASIPSAGNILVQGALDVWCFSASVESLEAGLPIIRWVPPPPAAEPYDGPLLLPRTTFESLIVLPAGHTTLPSVPPVFDAARAVAVNAAGDRILAFAQGHDDLFVWDASLAVPVGTLASPASVMPGSYSLNARDILFYIAWGNSWAMYLDGTALFSDASALFQSPPGFEPFWEARSDCIAASTDRVAVGGGDMERIDTYRLDGAFQSSLLVPELVGLAVWALQFDMNGYLWVAASQSLFVVGIDGQVIAHFDLEGIWEMGLSPIRSEGQMRIDRRSWLWCQGSEALFAIDLLGLEAGHR